MLFLLHKPEIVRSGFSLKDADYKKKEEKRKARRNYFDALKLHHTYQQTSKEDEFTFSITFLNKGF